MRAIENKVIKKRLNTYKSSNGRLSKVDDEVVLEVLRAWENWQGTAAGLYREFLCEASDPGTILEYFFKGTEPGAGGTSETDINYWDSPDL